MGPVSGKRMAHRRQASTRHRGFGIGLQMSQIRQREYCTHEELPTESSYDEDDNDCWLDPADEL
eukprot:11400953-Karenia_brevis.AAC.1